MKNIVFEIGMDYEVKGNELVLDFSAGVKGRFNEVLTDDEFEIIKEATKDISKVLNDALIRDFKSEMKEKHEKEEERLDKIDKLQRELYELMSEDCKKEIDEFEKEINKLETDEEKAMFAFKELLKVMKEIEGNDR